VRASTYPQLQSIPKMLNKMSVADFPIIVGSIDPCFSCTERVITVDARSNKIRTYTKQELLAMSQRRSGQGKRL
jgi:Ni,Fe-hydrogenase III large subunit